LPAVLDSSDYLKEKYRQPVEAINLTSKNFKDDYVFLKSEDGQLVNPYKSLPPLFEGLTNEQLEEALENARTEAPQIADGGAALFAYAKLQGRGISDLEHSETVDALLRYCELDTLAMVMIYEHFKTIAKFNNLLTSLF
jgi:hypothetical protein